MSAQLADSMTQDDRIFATLETRVLAVLGLPFRVEQSTVKGTEELSAEIAADVDSWWFEQFPEGLWADVIRWSLQMGFAIGQLFWTTAHRLPVLVLHHPYFCSWDGDEQAYFVETTEGGKKERVTPGDGNWVLFAPHGVTRPHMRAMLRAIAVPFLLRTFARRDWATRSEIEGIGIRKAGVPDRAKPEIVKQFLKEVDELGSDSTLKLPEGYTFDIAAIDASAADGFDKLIAHCDTGITLPILGQNLTTQIEGGSYAAATAHARVQLDRTEADVAMLATGGHQQILVPWVLAERGEDAVKATPWPLFDSTPPEDLQKYAVALQSLAQALPALDAAKVDTQPLLERFRLKRLSQGQTP